MAFLHPQLLTLRRPVIPATGTVAARVQRFQHAAELEHPTSSSRLPRVMTRAQESGTTVGRGRRLDTNFGSPAGRASRDGNEGLRGDGRPPVGNIMRTVHSGVEQEIVLRPLQLLTPRPSTSFDGDGGSTVATTEITPVNALNPVRKPRSLENLPQSTNADNEIFQKRARLRSVNQPNSPGRAVPERKNVDFNTPGHQNEGTQDSLESHKILSELGTLLVGAIERVNPPTGQPNDEIAGSTALTYITGQSSTPETLSRHHGRWRNSFSAGPPRLQSTSRHRKSNTEDSRVPKSSADMDSVEQFEMLCDDGPPEPLLKKEQESLPVATSSLEGPSPVKSRVAVFEKMKYRIPSEYVHDRHNREDNVTASSVWSVRQNLVKQESRSSPAHTPPIELALPRLNSHPRQDSLRSSGSVHSQSGQYESAKQSTATSAPTLKRTQDRKTSIPWPFRWNLFPHDKGTPVPPKSSGVEAKAEIKHDEHVTSSSVEHITSHVNISPAKSKSSPRRMPNQKQPISGNTADQELRGLSPWQDTAETLTKERVSKKVEPDESQQLLSETDSQKPQTPKKRTSLKSLQMMTPIKSDKPRLKSSMAASSPRTPFRGRARSECRDNYAVEHQYSLSRSRSRGGVKIQVEVRSPDPSPDRAVDDTIVIIRANVEPMD